MNTLKQIEVILLPIWNKLYKEDKENIPKSFVKLMTYIIPKYKDYNFDTLLGKLKKKGVIQALRKTQIDLIELNLLSEKQQKIFIEIIDLFQGEKFNREYFRNIFTDSTGSTHSIDLWQAIFKKQIPKKILDKIKNKPFIDLGCGPSGSVGLTLKIISNLGASMYIGVDKYRYGKNLSKEEFQDLYNEEHKGAPDVYIKERDTFEKLTDGHTSSTSPWPDRYEKLGIRKDLKVNIIYDDLLSFLKSIPSNFGNVFVSYIDFQIISDEGYRSVMEEEIIRVIPKGGIFIDNCSFIPTFRKDLFNKKMKKVLEKIAHPSNQDRGLFIYEKISYQNENN